MIKLYSLTTCFWCDKVKDLLEEKEVKFSLIEVDTLSGDEQAEALAEIDRLTGQRAFPITVIGDQAILGYDEKELLKGIENCR
ncbi:MAG: glutaredoxin family protein [Dethiobacteria bacterium]